MNKNQKRLVRLIAIVLAVLLAGSAITSAIFSLAYGEEAISAPVYDCELTMEYMENEQALRMSQRLVYTNETGAELDRVVFCAPANLFRRQDALIMAVDDAQAALPYGYLPGGIELASVKVNGENADYGFQGENEIYLRVACELQPGESCEFLFDCFLLLTANRAFMGVSDTELRLSAFYFVPAYYDVKYGEFMLSSPTSFTRWVHAPRMNFRAEICLPEGCLLAATGEEKFEKASDGMNIWTVNAAEARDFSLSFGTKYKEDASGGLRSLAEKKGTAKKLLDYAEEAVSVCESWFGEFPAAQMDFMESGDAEAYRSNTGCAWFSKELLDKGGDNLRRAAYFCVAQQYFGMKAYARVGADAWLSDSMCEYLSYLILEETEGYEAYLKALNENIVPSLQLTIPGGLNVVSDAALFTDSEYEIVVLDRGAAVFHELRTAMGRDELIEGLKSFYQKGLNTDVLEEMDLVDALDAASGGSWEAFLTDWLYNIGDYVNQDIYWLD